MRNAIAGVIRKVDVAPVRRRDLCKVTVGVARERVSITVAIAHRHEGSDSRRLGVFSIRELIKRSILQRQMPSAANIFDLRLVES